VEVGGSILTKFGSLMLNSLPITAKWSSWPARNRRKIPIWRTFVFPNRK